MSASRPRTRPWADLSPDLLFDVSARLHDAVDFIRFHAVCKPWHHSADAAPLSPAPRRMLFMPWLLAPYEGRILHSAVDIGRAVFLAAPRGNDNFVVSDDGTAAWLFTTTGQQPDPPGLLDVITGAITPLPRFPAPADGMWPMEKFRGVVYGDGTVFMYEYCRDRKAITAAVLRPGGAAAWTLVQNRLDFPAAHNYSAAAYHDGKVLICSGRHFSCVLDLTRWDEREETIEYDCDFREAKIGLGSYLLESRGELLLASVLMEPSSWYRCGHAHARDGPGAGLSVSVHALEKANDGGGGKKKMRWVPRDGRSLGDRVLFLGSPVSYAAEAARIGMAGGGGCAYFVYSRRVFRHGLVDKETKLVKGPMPRGWGAGEVHVWLQPRPVIAPIQEIAERALHARTKQEPTNLMR